MWPSGEKPACNAGDVIHFLGQEDPVEREMAIHSCSSCLGNPMDKGAWRATVHGDAKNQTCLSD